MAVEIESEDYSVPWQGVIYEVTYSGHRYACVVAIHHLKMKVGKNAVAEFRTRLSDIEQATEDMLRRVRGGKEDGRRDPNERLIVSFGGELVISSETVGRRRNCAAGHAPTTTRCR